MTIPPPSEDEYVNRLYDSIRKELADIFGHTASQASELFAEFYTRHAEFDEDFYWHQGPFNAALRVHYEQVLQRDASASDFIDWRQSYDAVWDERRR